MSEQEDKTWKSHMQASIGLRGMTVSSSKSHTSKLISARTRGCGSWFEDRQDESLDINEGSILYCR